MRAGTTNTTNLAHCWGEQYNYDAWGNLLSISGIQPTYNGCTQESGFSFASATSKNQIPTYAYDAAGNLMNIPGGASYFYDAENHLLCAAPTCTGQITYSYDGEGKRVIKSNGTIYWYGLGSDVLTETDFGNDELSSYVYFAGRRMARTDYSNQVDFYLTDALGTTRFLHSVVGGPGNGTEYSADYYPFGAERVVSAGGPPNDYKFTGKERDSESGLDNFGARYYGSSMGRFISPDWAAKAQPVPYAKLDNPQSLNLYAYVLNNPLIHIDADGHIIDDSNLKDNKDYQKWKKNYLKQKGAQEQWDALKNNKDLTVHMGWDSKANTSMTSGYVWSSKGDLASVNVTLGKGTGNTDNQMSASSGYIHGSTLNNDGAMRQAYVIAHEFAHVEYAETPTGGTSLRQDEQTGQHLQELYKQLGPRLYPLQPGVGDMQRQLDQDHYDREKAADQRAWDVLGDPK